MGLWVDGRKGGGEASHPLPSSPPPCQVPERIRKMQGKKKRQANLEFLRLACPFALPVPLPLHELHELPLSAWPGYRSQPLLISTQYESFTYPMAGRQVWYWGGVVVFSLAHSRVRGWCGGFHEGGRAGDDWGRGGGMKKGLVWGQDCREVPQIAELSLFSHSRGGRDGSIGPSATCLMRTSKRTRNWGKGYGEIKSTRSGRGWKRGYRRGWKDKSCRKSVGNCLCKKQGKQN